MVKSFNSKIGFITNLASNFIAMLSNYPEDSREHKEIRKRIDLLRYYQGSKLALLCSNAQIKIQ
jgi:hypothetical protein